MLLLQYAPETLVIPLVLFFNKNYKLGFVILSILLFIFRKGSVNFIKNKNTIISPAEGEIVEIKKEGDFTKISIFLNPINKHFQISPVSGIINSVKYIPGKFEMAYNEISTSNERVETSINSLDFGTVIVRQIAGYLFKRIVNTTNKGLKIEQGDFMGLIKFSSKVELLVLNKNNVRVNVKKGDNVKLGDVIFYRY